MKGNDSNLDEYVNSQTFDPPGARPLRTGKTPTKTQAAAEQKAEKEAKEKETEGKKLAAAARRADAKNKKQERLITATKTKAQKAVSKADELRKKLDDAKKAIEEKFPASLTGGAQSNKKIKGAAGKSTPTSTTAIASFVESPQRKAFSTKKRVNTHSPYRYCSLALLTGGLSKSSSIFEALGSGPTLDRQIWLANIDSACVAAHLAQAGTLTPAALLISLLYSVIHEQHYHRIPKFQRISLSSSQTFYHLVGDITFLFLVLGDR